MLETFRDWLNYWPNAALLFFLIVIPCSLCSLMISQQNTVVEAKAIETMELQEKLMLTLTWPYLNENLTYQPVSYTVTNEQNYSVQLRMELSSEPLELIRYIDFSCSIKNSTILNVGESFPLVVNISTHSNPENMTGDFNLKIYGEPT